MTARNLRHDKNVSRGAALRSQTHHSGTIGWVTPITDAGRYMKFGFMPKGRLSGALIMYGVASYLRWVRCLVETVSITSDIKRASIKGP